MIRQQGKLVEVFTRPLGDYTISRVSSGATALPVNFPFDFREYGGQLYIPDTDTIHNYDTVDYETATIYLNSGSPTVTALEEITQILAYPEGEEKLAVIDIGPPEQETVEVV